MTRTLNPGTFAWLVVLGWAAQTNAAGPNERLLELQADIEQVHRLDGELADVENQEQSVRGDDPREPTLKRRYGELLLRAARLKQSAIRRAIATYRIDVSRLHLGVSYSPHGDMRDREGATYLDEDGTVRVEIGDEAFASAARLGSTIAHEVEVHVNRQIAKGVYYPSTDEQGTLIQEVEAYDHELASKDRFELGADELKLLKQRRASYYRRLEWENRKRADVALYVKW
jgi:hypothetical protein